MLELQATTLPLTARFDLLAAMLAVLEALQPIKTLPAAYAGGVFIVQLQLPQATLVCLTTHFFQIVGAAAQSSIAKVRE